MRFHFFVLFWWGCCYARCLLMAVVLLYCLNMSLKFFFPISIIHLGLLHLGSGRHKGVCVERKESKQSWETGCHGPSSGECIDSFWEWRITSDGMAFSWKRLKSESSIKLYLAWLCRSLSKPKTTRSQQMWRRWMTEQSRRFSNSCFRCGQWRSKHKG